MRRFYRLTSRSLPARRPGRISEMASNHRVTAAVLIVAAAVGCVTPRLMLSGADGEAADRLADASPVEEALTPLREQGGGNVLVAGAVAPLFVPTADLNPAEGFTQVAVQDGPPATAPVPPQAARTPGAESDGEDRPQPRHSLAGVWAPHRAACDKHAAARTGWLPMKITDRGARAGQTTCSFRRLSGEGSAWTAVAECSGPRGHWVSNVRLGLEASSLTWSSARGVRRYVRCDRVQVAAR